MTAPVRLRAAALAARCCWCVLVAVTLAVGTFTFDGLSVRADQYVTFDDAGNAPHISAIGDSTLAGVRWYADYGALEQFNFVLSAESCRRTIEQSCISREGYRSENVVSSMRSLDGRLGTVLVIMSGYNDPIWTIDEAIAGVVGEARRQGVDHVVWLSLRTSPDVDYHDPQEQTSINTFREYNDQLVVAAEESDGYLQVADWATYSNGKSSWFAYDGVHLTPQGVDGVTTFIASMVTRVLAGENVSPSAAPWTVLVPGAEGDAVTAVQEALIADGIEVNGGADGAYGNDTMAAVAEYQRRSGDLQVTGAVDMATARSLGLFDEPVVVAAVDEAAVAPATTTAAPSVAVTDRLTEPSPGDDGASSRWLLFGATILVVLAAAIALRRRYVVAQRAARRWARVHPATSPRRSVADMRRSGELPPRPAAARRSEDLESAAPEGD